MIHSAEDVLLDSAKRVLVDANVIIAFFDIKHRFHQTVHSRLNPVYLLGADFYYVQPCLLELKEYWRRKKITECLDICLEEDYRLFHKFEKTLRDFRSDNVKRKSLYLKDWQLKDLRSTLENVAKGKGIAHWLSLCEKAMTGSMADLDEELKGSRFKYAKFGDGDVYPNENEAYWPKWEQADRIQEKFGLASNDAAILNMVNGAKDIDAFITNDGDMLFAIMNGALQVSLPVYTFLNTSPYQ
jgi:predicted nucleic acid-binding protein